MWHAFLENTSSPTVDINLVNVDEMYLKVLLLAAISAACAERNVLGVQNAGVFFAESMYLHSDPYRSVIIAARFNKTNEFGVPQDMAHCLMRHRGPALRIISEIQEDFAEKCLSDNTPHGNAAVDNDGASVVVDDGIKTCHKNLLDSVPVSRKVKTFLKEKLLACEKRMNDIDNSFHEISEGNEINSKLFYKEILDNAVKYANKMIGKRCDAMKEELNGKILTQQAKELLAFSWQDMHNLTAKLNAVAATAFEKNADNEIIYEQYDRCFSPIKLEVTNLMASFSNKIANCISNLVRLKETANADKLALLEKVDALRKKQVKDLKAVCVKEIVGDVDYVSEEDGLKSVNCIKSEMMTTVEQAIRKVELEVSDFVFDHFVQGSSSVVAASQETSACFNSLNFDWVLEQTVKQTEEALLCVGEEMRKEESKKKSWRTEEL